MPAIGDAGEATFEMDVEVGATVHYSWSTDVIPMWSGKEQRRSLLAVPRQRYEFSAALSDAEQQLVLATLAREAAAAPVFLLGLRHESLPVRSSTSSTIVLHSASLCDWAKDGQRIVVRSPTGVQAETFIDGAPAGDTLTTGDDVSAAAVPGALVMPLMQVRLAPDQDFARYQIERTNWSIVAHADRFRYGSDGTMGVGASVTTYDSLPVWDRGIGINGTVSQPILTGADLVDLGAKLSSAGNFTAAQWLRGLSFVGSNRAEWQWLKKFLDTVKGRWKTFLLRTGRPDLVADGDASTGTLTVTSNYAADWFPSLAHRRLAIILDDGSVNYRTVESTAGSGDELVLDSSLAGTIERVELLETVRLDSDEVSVSFEWPRTTAQMSARVVQG